MRKTCFVTVGATAAFDALIFAILELEFLQALQSLDYTELKIQYGKNGAAKFHTLMEQERGPSDKGRSLEISGFDFNPRGLGIEMKACKGSEDAVEGVVISHAGSGSILDALRISVPLIVVPNTDLLDNHQDELAEAMAKQGYAIHGQLKDLALALKLSEKLRQRTIAWPPETARGDGRGLIGVMDDELGFVD